MYFAVLYKSTNCFFLKFTFWVLAPVRFYVIGCKPALDLLLRMLFPTFFFSFGRGERGKERRRGAIRPLTNGWSFSISITVSPNENGGKRRQGKGQLGILTRWGGGGWGSNSFSHLKYATGDYARDTRLVTGACYNSVFLFLCLRRWTPTHRLRRKLWLRAQISPRKKYRMLWLGNIHGAVDTTAYVAHLSSR